MKSQIKEMKVDLFEQIKQGLKESISQVRGEITLRSTTLPIAPPRYSKDKVKAIRKQFGMSQSVFAKYLNVPIKTLQSWEHGEREPKAGAARLLQIVESKPNVFELLTPGHNQPEFTAPVKRNPRQLKR